MAGELGRREDAETEHRYALSMGVVVYAAVAVLFVPVASGG